MEEESCSLPFRAIEVAEDLTVILIYLTLLLKNVLWPHHFLSQCTFTICDCFIYPPSNHHINQYFATRTLRGQIAATLYIHSPDQEGKRVPSFGGSISVETASLVESFVGFI
mmetsp:Transcript_6467/g.24325  ORF Transcript_6467/g.24325 Transcript_6467/m.24325 type:complete len:112 (+) Transcript_6467:407-742(+)